MKSIGFIGFGNMAQALAAAWIKLPDYRLYAAAPSLAHGVTADGIYTEQDNLIVATCDVIILAVKPQQAHAVLRQIHAVLKPDSILISVVAGLSIESLTKVCNINQAIIRSMPNLPVASNMGATPLLANTAAQDAQKLLAESLFAAVGIVTWLDSDDLIDRMTALSGSGPAYVLYFLESLIAAGEHLKLPADVLHDFAIQTMRGTLSLIDKNQYSLQELRDKITSPKGTTAAAIEVMQKSNLALIIQQALDAAYKRAQEI